MRQNPSNDYNIPPADQRKLRRQRKKKKRIKIFIRFLLILASIGLLSYLLFFTPFFNVKSIEFFDNDRLSKETLLKVSGLKAEENIFLVKKNKALDKLKTLPYVSDVSIIRVFPDTLKVYVTERVPVCIFIQSKKYLYIDGSGRILEISDSLKDWDIPVVSGAEKVIKNPVAGSNLKMEPAWVRNNVIDSIKTLADKSLTKYISEINITKEKQLYLYTTGGSIIMVKDNSSILEKIDFLSTYLIEKDNRMIIDLTHGGNPTYTPR
ncbi:MAG: FtsQ-type POTRA domain-containing protein [Eubacteriaceae bacterium]|nr:FtsQ-type POTRA domain-containing protein [Eubacteriaceae bacterium]